MLEYAYDDAAESGLYQKVTKTVVGDAAAPSIVTTQYTDKCGNVVKTGQLLNGTEHLDTFVYDYVGNKTLELSAADAARNLPFTAKYEYNENGQVVKAYNAAGQFTTSTYNALGQLIQTTDYAGTPTVYTYDALGRLLSQTVTIEDDITAVSKYEYNGCGNIIREWKPVQAVGTAAEWSKTEYTYNSRKKLISAKQYDGSTPASETAYTYDGVGNMLSMNAGGSTTSYTYDRFGNVLSTTDALGQAETNAYSALGRLESKTDRNGIVTSYTYDALGRVLSVSAGSGDSAQTILYTYTKTGQLRSEENGWQRSTYAYDAIGQLIGADEVELASLPAVESSFYNITLDANGGTVTPETLSVSTDESYTLPVPTRSGYTFTGWFLGETQILDGTPVQLTGDVTFVAHWAANTYTVTLDANGGTVTPETLSVSTDESYTLPVPTRSGYTFTGWFLGETQILDGTPVQLTGDATFVAHWAINTYTVTFDWNYEDNQRTLQVAHGSSCTVPAITRKGYTLTGWLCGETRYTAGTSVTITENTTFTAQWKANTYTVEYPTIKSICEGRELPAYEAASEFTAKIGAQLDELLPELGGEDGTLKTLEKLQAARNHAQQKLAELLAQMRDSVQNPTLEQAVIDAANQAESKTQQTEAVAKMVDTTARQNKAAIFECVSAAVGAAAEKAKEVQTILGAWSDDAGTMEKNAVNTELLQKVRQSPALLEISKHLGRFREIFAQGKRNGYAYGRGETYALELGNDLSRAIGSEFAMLASPQTLPLFVKKYQQRRLKQYRRREPVHKGMGDIICCLDESGSTRGDAAAWGKAVALTLLDTFAL